MRNDEKLVFHASREACVTSAERQALQTEVTTAGRETPSKTNCSHSRDYILNTPIIENITYDVSNGESIDWVPQFAKYPVRNR